MNRGVITISESGTVSMPTDTVWMTMQEIADMYNVFGCYVRKAVKAVFKDGILKEQGVRRHVRKNDRISYDALSLDELLLDKMPCQLLDALSIVLLYELLALILVVSQHDTFQECIWELQFTNLLLAVLANIEDELII